MKEKILAIVDFQPYLYGQYFILVIDHQSLKLLMKSNKFIDKLIK